MQRNALLIGGIAVAAALTVTYVFFGQSAELGPVGEVFNDSELLPEDGGVLSVPDSGDEDESADGKASNGNGTPKISIATSPYTVYIGGASKYGTTTANMDAEVPLAVVGYEWEALPESIMFSTVVLPEWGDPNAAYDVAVWEDGAYRSLGRFTPGETVELPREQLTGTHRFRVTGIDSALRVCPGDRSFSWGTRFTFNGPMALVRTPIVEPLPDGVSCALR